MIRVFFLLFIVGAFNLNYSLFLQVNSEIHRDRADNLELNEQENLISDNTDLNQFISIWENIPINTELDVIRENQEMNGNEPSPELYVPESRQCWGCLSIFR